MGNKLNDLLFSELEEWRLVFWEKPLPFREFVVSKDHLGLKPLSEKQFSALFKLIGNDPLKVFSKERKKHIGIYVLGKGAGKDYMVSVLLAYLFYLLLLMINPHEQFNLASDENIDILNVAPTAAQAERVFFYKYRSRILNWKWFLRNFKVVWRGKVVKQSVGSRQEVRITDNSIETSNGIRNFSLHAEAENYEGFNVLVAILDETSSFEDKFEEVIGGDGDIINVGKADLIYNTLRTSAASRKLPWIMIAISFPRRADDWTILKYEEAQKDPTGIMVSERGCTWEYNPIYDGEETFKFSDAEMTWDVPISLKSDFDSDPINSKMKYCTYPPTVLNRFFYNDERIQSAIDERIEPLLVCEDAEDAVVDANGKTVKFIVKRVLSSRADIDKTKPYAVGVDLSILKDKTTVCVGHGEPCSEIKSMFINPDGSQSLTTIQMKIVIDQILVWKPNIKKKVLVSHLNVDEILESIHGMTGFTYISYDQYQSQYVLEKALRSGIVSERHNVKELDYLLYRNYLHAGGLSYAKNPELIFEMERLVYDGKKVDHLPIFSNDLVCSVAHVVRAIAGGLAKAQDIMAFTFATDEMFNPAAATNPLQGLPQLPKEALINTGQEINPNDFGLFLG